MGKHKKKLLFATVLSFIVPGTGHVMLGEVVRGLAWFGSLFAIAAAVYYFIGDAPSLYYSGLGLVIAILAARDAYLYSERSAVQEEPTVLKP